MDIQAKQKQLNNIFEENSVILAYIFGSVAKRKENELSDLDIAVFFDKKITEGEQGKKETNLSFKIGKLFGIDRVDVVGLNNINNPLFLYNIVLNGQAILVKNQRLKSSLERRALREYEDTAYLRNVSSKIMHSQIKRNIFGAAKL
jgi:predicted nucleotidyltransferase